MTDGSFPEDVGIVAESTESLRNTSENRIDLNSSSLSAPIPNGEKPQQFLKNEAEMYYRQLDKVMAKLGSEALEKGKECLDGRRELQMNGINVNYQTTSAQPYVTAETFIDFREWYQNAKKVRATIDWGSPAGDAANLTKLIEEGFIDSRDPSSEIVFHEQGPYFELTSTLFYIVGDRLLKFADVGKNEELRYEQSEPSLSDLIMLRVAINEFSKKSECGQEALSVASEDFTKGYDFQPDTSWK